MCRRRPAAATTSPHMFPADNGVVNLVRDPLSLSCCLVTALVQECSNRDALQDVPFGALLKRASILLDTLLAARCGVYRVHPCCWTDVPDCRGS